MNPDFADAAVSAELSQEAHDFEVHQGRDVVDVRAIAITAVVSFLVGGLGVFFAGVILVATDGALRPSFAGPSGPRPVRRELSHVEQTMIEDTRTGIDLRERQRRELDGWGWVDRDAGVARIPIDRAIEIVAGRTSR
jgi:hypothetical protein